MGAMVNSKIIQHAQNTEILRSQYLPDEMLGALIKNRMIATNIRSRRGRKVEINVPIFRDENTSWPFCDPTVDYELHRWPEDNDVRNGAVKENCIYMDNLLFGVGSCCLQVTMQAQDIDQARTLHDQLLPLGPIMLALTAATPAYKGYLVDTDVRWNQNGSAMDDRTAEELGEKPLQNDRWRIAKSRAASNSTYIARDPRLRHEYLDPDLILDPDVKQKLIDGGMDDLLASHFAHLFIRDPVFLYAEVLESLNLEKTNHFEMFQATNYHHVRFKPPPSHTSDIGWRVEFRPMEVQVTDFENAAYAIFMILISRVILDYDLNLYIPITKVDENMETAHARDAVLERKFHFRKTIFSTAAAGRRSNGVSRSEKTGAPTNLTSKTPASNSTGIVADEYRPMTINEIINGGSSSSDGFPGLMPLVKRYLVERDLSAEARLKVHAYLHLIEKRASGALWTGAKWIRHFIRRHPQYGRDSVVSEGVSYDLLKAVEDMTRLEAGSAWGKEMLGEDGHV